MIVNGSKLKEQFKNIWWNLGFNIKDTLPSARGTFNL